MNTDTPLRSLPDHQRAEIERLVACPTPPPRWLDLGLARIESRAWHEWRRARGLGKSRSLSPQIRDAVIRRDGYVCGICGGDVEPADVHIDHVHPVALGGTDALANLRVSHSLCNLRKGARV